MLVLIAKIAAALSAYGKTSQIAFAMALGLSFSMIPGGNLLSYLIFILLILLPINLAGLLSVLAVSKIFVFLFDPFIENLGYVLLTRPEMLKPMTSILATPGMGWLRLNDSIIFGSLIFAVILLPFGFLAFMGLIHLYRKFIASRMNQWLRKISGSIPWLKRLISMINSLRKNGGLI